MRSTAMDAPSPHRMTAEEAAAKADALIAQYRATTPRKSRASQPRISDLPSPKALLGDRMKLLLVFVFACLAGYQLHAARFVSSANEIVSASLPVAAMKS